MNPGLAFRLMRRRINLRTRHRANERFGRFRQFRNRVR